MKTALSVLAVGLCAGLLGTTVMAATNSSNLASQLTASNNAPTTLDHRMMYAGHWHGGGWHGGWRGGWRGGWGGGWNNAGWVVPAVAATALTAAAISSQNRYYYGGGYGGGYACQAYFRGYMYQGAYRPGGPCYINVGGEVIGVSRFSRY